MPCSLSLNRRVLDSAPISQNQDQPLKLQYWQFWAKCDTPFFWANNKYTYLVMQICTAKVDKTLVTMFIGAIVLNIFAVKLMAICRWWARGPAGSSKIVNFYCCLIYQQLTTIMVYCTKKDLMLCNFSQHKLFDCLRVQITLTITQLALIDKYLAEVKTII